MTLSLRPPWVSSLDERRRDTRTMQAGKELRKEEYIRKGRGGGRMEKKGERRETKDQEKDKSQATPAISQSTPLESDGGRPLTRASYTGLLHGPLTRASADSSLGI
ncbi:hypothetical protein NHX12_032317 [Muraenolepis orangiensis]|uniref:Uncharacterized protein n=1 Tax=Muraenolepis orangiensis TaxID=630683 RepID=A0A9Q0ILE8_9TELE|nr:hypothetical protein NHX12_032317 [Muraenolepis orangiensis]